MQNSTSQMAALGVTAALGVAVVVAVKILRRPRNESQASASDAAVKSSKLKPQTVSEGFDRTTSGGLDIEQGVWIYFGSQTGTADRFANQLLDEAADHNLSAAVVDLEDFEPEVFVRHPAVILVTATYGEGEPTDNAMEFFKWLQDKDLPEDTLEGTKFTVMGLGSRQYVNFNSAGITADKHMARLGATRVHRLGKGDDDEDIEADFEAWREEGLWPALQSALGQVVESAEPKKSSVRTAGEESAKLSLKMHLFSDGEAPPVDPMVQNGGADVLGKWYFQASLVPVASCRELMQVPEPGAGKTTKHIDVDVSCNPGMVWKTADNLEVLPQNSLEAVQWFAKRLGVEHQLDESITFVRAAGVDKVVKKPFPCPCSVREALTLYCDLNAAPVKYLASKLASFVVDEEEREAATNLLSDAAAYTWLTSEACLNLQEFFELVIPSAQLDLGSFLQLCPRQKSRAYTIASSSREDKQTIGLCVSMIQNDAPSMVQVAEGLSSRGHDLPGAQGLLSQLNGTAAGKRRFRGACSTMLCTQTAPGDKLWVFARASSFRLPRKTTAPVVMIGAGTGVAPFRGFMREFHSEKGRREKTTLFFGCTHRDRDFLYREEFSDATSQDPPPLRELVTAFSREQAHKVYVQHRLQERSEDMKSLMSEGAYIYVCGATAMGAAVREVLAPMVGGAEGLKRIQAEGRFVEELW